MKELLTRKVGPFPVGVWLLVIVGGLGIGFYARRATASFGSGGADDPGVTTAGGTMTGGVPLSPTNQPLTNNNVNALGQPILGTNEEWYAWAYTQLVARGFGAGAAVDALTNYLSGQPLNEAQSRIIDAALQYAGAPPQLLPPTQRTPVTPVVPNPSTTPPTTPPTVPVGAVVTPPPTASFAVTTPPVASVLELLTPNQAVSIDLPVAGDRSQANVIGRTSEGFGFIYGGNAEQARMLTGGQVVPNTANAGAPALTLAQKYDQMRREGLDPFRYNVRALSGRAASGAPLTAEEKRAAQILGVA